jgi:hypothetical protein
LEFATKPQLALQMIEAAWDAGLAAPHSNSRLTGCCPAPQIVLAENGGVYPNLGSVTSLVIVPTIHDQVPAHAADCALIRAGFSNEYGCRADSPK